MLTHKGTQTIQTERLTLRRFRSEDAHDMYENWASDDEVTKYLTWPSHASAEISAMLLQDWIKHYEEPDFYQWAIEFEGRVIGSISVVSLDQYVEKGKYNKAIIRRI